MILAYLLQAGHGVRTEFLVKEQSQGFLLNRRSLVRRSYHRNDKALVNTSKQAGQQDEPTSEILHSTDPTDPTDPHNTNISSNSGDDSDSQKV